MKKTFLSLAAALLCSTALQAQTVYEAANMLNGDLDGTARFVGMGGAMNALGGDVSVMNTNPAGIALYRSSDMMFSFGAEGTMQRSKYQASKNRAGKVNGAFDNFGMVFANKHSNEGALRFVNFGVNYRRTKDFNQNLYVDGNLNGLSQTGQMANQAFNNGAIGDAHFDAANDGSFYNYNYYKSPNFGWLTLMGADGRLIDGNSLYNGGDYYPSQSFDYTSREYGGMGEWGFNLSFNFVDQVYLGATLGIKSMNYNYYSLYNEYFEDGSYQFENWYKTKGSGVNFGIGAIIRPFENSSFRLGIAAVTPTIMELTDYNSAIIESWIGEDNISMDTQSDDAFGGDCYTEYSVTTPATINLSMAYTIGTSIAMDAEYEYSNFAAMGFYEGNGKGNKLMNEEVGNVLKAQHTFRVGIEKSYGGFAARAGFAHSNGGFKQTAYKYIPVNSVQTNTDYTNVLHTNTVSCGCGYSGDIFYADVALYYSGRKSDFYPFDNIDLEATKVNRNMVKGLVTLGMQF